MRVILEPGDKPEMRTVVYSLQKCGLDFVIVESESQRMHHQPSDEEFRKAIKHVLSSFTVGTQWVAVYRVLVDFYGFPKTYDVFCNKIRKLTKGMEVSFPCDYQAIQKPLAQYAILQKSYKDWEGYVVKDGERFFLRQKMIADKLLEVLGVS